MSDILNELYGIYEDIKDEIIARLKEFDSLWKKGREEDIFRELVFCILTPQSKAEICWKTVKNLEDKNLLLEGTFEEILDELKNVRFRYKKAGYILNAREKFLRNGRIKIKEIVESKNILGTRERIVKEVKGVGYKEASHFLRNVGFGKEIAILDRHILKNLKVFGVINKIPMNLSRKKYLEIEKKMKILSKNINIPLLHLDFVLWYRETGKVFK